MARAVERLESLINLRLDNSDILHIIHPNQIAKTMTRTSTFQSDFQRAGQSWCEPGRSAETEWTSELSGRTITSSPIRILPLPSKGINLSKGRTRQSEAGFHPCITTGIFVKVAA